MENQNIEIFIVEDSLADVELMRECFARCQWQLNLNIATNGEDAVRYLKNEAPYTNSPRPKLILLDLNLPKKDGIEVLTEVRKDVALKSIPIIVLSTSNYETYIQKCYELGANCYITKPMGFEEFNKVINAICEFWLKIAHLPK